MVMRRPSRHSGSPTCSRSADATQTTRRCWRRRLSTSSRSSTPTSIDADCAIDALAAGAHVLIEKPVCLSLADLDRVIGRPRRGRKDRAGRLIMRRYAPAFTAMQARAAAAPSILHVAVRDIIGPECVFHRPDYHGGTSRRHPAGTGRGARPRRGADLEGTRPDIAGSRIGLPNALRPWQPRPLPCVDWSARRRA